VAKKAKIQRAGNVKVVGKVIRNGRDVWRVSSDGRVEQVTTKASSKRAIEEAVVIYGRALQRLAHR
jgi:hypothetical protein